jgi:hypothetical protein
VEIKRWIRDGINGDLSSTCETTEALLETAGRLLDRAYSHEIVGEVLFEGEDGKIYVGTVEFCIGEANPDYVKEVVSEEDSGEAGDSDGSVDGSGAAHVGAPDHQE